MRRWSCGGRKVELCQQRVLLSGACCCCTKGWGATPTPRRCATCAGWGKALHQQQPKAVQVTAGYHHHCRRRTLLSLSAPAGSPEPGRHHQARQGERGPHRLRHQAQRGQGILVRPDVAQSLLAARGVPPCHLCLGAALVHKQLDCTVSGSRPRRCLSLVRDSAQVCLGPGVVFPCSALLC